MNKKDKTVEYTVGPEFTLTERNLFVEELEDMEALEEWEDRLVDQKANFSVVFLTIKGKVKYNIYVNKVK